VFPDRLSTPRLHLARVAVPETPPTALYERFRADGPGERAFTHVPEEPFAHVGDAADHCHERAREWAAREAVHYVVLPRDDRAGDAPVAGLAAAWFEWELSTARLGLLLSPPFWGNEYATETNARLTRLAFERLDCETVEISHLVGNDNSRRAVEKFVERFGGEREGTLRQEDTVSGEPVDIVQYVVTREQFEAAEPAER
jgi:RimJ/RimL family protein N-acetyltransferase